MSERTRIAAAPSAEAVRAQLERILASEAFVRSRRIQRFLEFVVEEKLAGREEELGEYGIGVAVFDRGADFEPALDPIVRNDARRLRLKLLEYYRDTRNWQPDDVLIDMPKGGYIPAFLPVPVSETPIPHHHGCRLAVLPFEALSPEPDATMCGRALRVSLTAALTQVDGVETVAHGYETAPQMHLSHVIQGTVLKFDSRCRVIVHLVQVPEGTQLWSGAYDFETVEMMSLQSEISASVLSEVIAQLRPPVSHSSGLFLVA
jgi:TolB-like protein